MGHVARMGLMRNENKILENLCVHVRIILKFISEKTFWGVVWIHLAQDNYWWRAPVSTVMNL
jgi:hypothetical protein